MDEKRYQNFYVRWVLFTFPLMAHAILYPANVPITVELKQRVRKRGRNINLRQSKCVQNFVVMGFFSGCEMGISEINCRKINIDFSTKLMYSDYPMHPVSRITQIICLKCFFFLLLFIDKWLFIVIRTDFGCHKIERNKSIPSAHLKNSSSTMLLAK